jgi:dynein heavy chain, axonemal
MKQLPGENKRFKQVDLNWRSILNKTGDNPGILNRCEEPELLAAFKEMNETLDKVQKGLKDYLESKRAIFARFYFLADGDMLEILSQTKEVENVRPHLNKVFENMADLEFKPDKTIVAMYSAEREKIDFSTIVDPKGKGVEYWMGDVEDKMVMSVKEKLMDSIEDYRVTSRTDWIKKHPGQCVLNGSQYHWTFEVEEALLAGLPSLTKYMAKLESQLKDTVDLVRAKLTKLQSISLGALIVIDVHAKDVTAELLKKKIDTINAFEWISQLRYYIENEDMRVKCIQTNFPYGYEYLGNT